MTRRPIAHLKDIHVSKIYYQKDRGLTFGSSIEDKFKLTPSQFADTTFRFRADQLVLLSDFCTNDAVRKILKGLSRRGAVKKLDLSLCLVSDDMEPDLFNQMLQELKITEMEVKALSPTLWQQPAVKQLKSVKCNKFSMPLEYLSETAFEYCHLESYGILFNPIELNSVLKQWTNGQKEIKHWKIYCPPVMEKDLFEGFPKVSEDPPVNCLLPLSVYFLIPRVFTNAILEREDGKQLFLKYSNFVKAILLQDTPFY